MSKKVIYPLLFIAIYLLSLLALVPASYLVKQLEPHAPQLTVEGVSGTIWQGEIQYLQMDMIELENLRWSLSALGLLLGQAKIDFISVSSQQSIEGRLEASLWGDEAELSQLRARFPLSLYAQQLMLAQFDLSGQLELQLEQLHYQQGVIGDGKGALVWHQAGIEKSLQLGDLMLDWQLQDGKLEGKLSELDGPVALDGNVSLSHAGQYQFNAQLEVKDNSDVDLKQTMRLFGRSVGENRVQLERKGQLPMPAGLRLQ